MTDEELRSFVTGSIEAWGRMDDFYGRLEAGLTAVVEGQKGMEVRLDRLEVGQKGLETGQKGLETGQKGLETGQKGLETGQKALETGQKGMEARLDRLEKGQEEIKVDLSEIKGDLRRIAERGDRLDGRLYRVEVNVVQDHETRIAALEAKAQ